MKPKFYISLFILSIILMVAPMTSGVETWKYNYLEQGERVQFGGNYTINTNSTDNWITNIGSLSGVSALQFNNNGGQLVIDEAYLRSFGDSEWLQLDGGNSPSANINWGGFGINNLGSLDMVGDINTDSTIQISNNGAGIQRVINASFTNSFAVGSIGLQNDNGLGVVLAVAGSGIPTFENDAGMFVSSGRLFLVDSANEDIVMGHGALDTGVNFTWTLSPDGTVTQTGPLVMNGSKIFIDGVRDHFITTNVDGYPFNGIAQNATWFGHDFMRDDGEITYLFTWENNTNMWLQAGRNNSFSSIGNSFVLVPQKMASNNFTEPDGTINMTKASDYLFICNFFGLDCVFNADTNSEGPLLGTLGPAEIIGGIKGHGGISIDGPSIFNLEGNDMNINNGSVHILTPVTFLQGFTAGDSVTKFIETFSSGLGIFTNLQSDLGDWVSVLNSVLCDEGQCAQGDGAGVGLVEMQTNISTLDINETTLSFVYSLVNLIGAGEFSIEVNNNVGSGDIEIFSDTTDTVIKESETISLPSSMDDKSLVTITFICDIGNAAKPTRQCFADTVKLNGTAITTTLINVSGFNSEICFSDGIRGSNGLCSRGLFYNASADLVTTQGTWNISGTVSGGVTGTGSTNNIAKFASTTSLTNSQITDDGVLITLGLPTLMQGNANIGGFDIFNIKDMNSSHINVIGEGQSMGGVTLESVGYFKNTLSGRHSAVVIDSLNGQDAFIIFAEDSNPRWDMRADAGTNNYQIRDQVGGANTVALEIEDGTRDATFTGDIETLQDVGIGQSPVSANKLTVFDSIANNLALFKSGDSGAGVEFKDDLTNSAAGYVAVRAVADDLVFRAGGINHGILNSSGDLWINKSINTTTYYGDGSQLTGIESLWTNESGVTTSIQAVDIRDDLDVGTTPVAVVALATVNTVPSPAFLTVVEDIVPSPIPSGSISGYTLIFLDGALVGQEFILNSATNSAPDSLFTDGNFIGASPGDTFEIMSVVERDLTISGSAVIAKNITLDGNLIFTSSLNDFSITNDPDVPISPYIFKREGGITEFWGGVNRYIFNEDTTSIFGVNDAGGSALTELHGDRITLGETGSPHSNNIQITSSVIKIDPAGSTVVVGIGDSSGSGDSGSLDIYKQTNFIIDNLKSCWGAGLDGCVYYDGDDMYIDPAVIDPTSELKILGDTNIDGDLSVSHIGINGQNGNSAAGIFDRITHTVSGYTSYDAGISIEPDGTMANIISGMILSMELKNSNDNVTRVVGINGQITAPFMGGYFGTVNTVTAITAGLSFNGNFGSGPTITNAIGFDLSGISASTGATVTNAIGIKLGNVAGATTINRAIQTGLGLVHFGDDVEVLGIINATEDIITNERFFLGNNASIGGNSTCAFIFYNQTGAIINTMGCS